MLIGVLKEARSSEARVAATPATVAQLRQLGYDVVVEPGAGLASDFADAEFLDAGATIGSLEKAHILLGVGAPSSEQLDDARTDVVVIATLAPQTDARMVEYLARRPVTALAMDAVPRISRAQSLDVLSSMANIAGYRAVMEAAHVFGRFFTGQVTAAGKVPPAQVLVAGAGVAGLAAVGVAGSLGAVVNATDPRPEVADQIASLGGTYLSVEADDVEVSTSGYAKAMSDVYNERAEALYASVLPTTDILITTALIPGKPAPRLVTAGMVASMRRGSVIVDMAAASGGNVEGTVADRVVTTDNGVTIIGYTDLASRLPSQASQLYGTNLVNLLKLMTPAKNGELVVDTDDVVVRSMLVVHEGNLTWPPPPVAVSASVIHPPPSEVGPAESVAPASGMMRLAWAALAGLASFLLVAAAPAAFRIHLTVFALAIVIGYYVIGHVHHALHTPLMSVTNAVSGIIVVGALLQIGHGGTLVTTISFGAILLASINIFGGFAVTRRMLAMFTRG